MCLIDTMTQVHYVIYSCGHQTLYLLTKYCFENEGSYFGIVRKVNILNYIAKG